MKVVAIVAVCLLVGISCKALQEDNGNYCGGNCPNSDCQYCVCGINRNQIDVNNWCKGANWDQACCRCIISVVSKGNSNFMRAGSWGSGYAVGLTGIQGSDGEICGSR